MEGKYIYRYVHIIDLTTNRLQKKRFKQIRRFYTLVRPDGVYLMRYYKSFIYESGFGQNYCKITLMIKICFMFTNPSFIFERSQYFFDYYEGV